MRTKERNRAAAEWSNEPIAKLAAETAANLLADGFGELRWYRIAHLVVLA
jgi:hypothetical protein